MKLSTLINDFYRGNKAALAADAGVSRSAVSQWGDDSCLGADYVISICAGRAWQVKPHDIRPDIYPNATDGLPPERQAA